MASPVPKHLRSDDEIRSIPKRLRDHRYDLDVDPRNGVKIDGAGRRRAKYAPGLATALIHIAKSKSIGDPMAGVGTLGREAKFSVALNDIDSGMRQFLAPLRRDGHQVTFDPVHRLAWRRDVMIFSPPYYPRTDRRIPNAHDNKKRGDVVGFRDKYDCDRKDFIGNPGGSEAILTYRSQMREVYRHLKNKSDKMVVVTKNWVRLGVELRLDLDTILTAQEVGWTCKGRHGFMVNPSLWARYNLARGKSMGRVGMIDVEDVLIFERA